MLFPNNRQRSASQIIRRSLAFIVGLTAGLVRQHSDTAYLDGMRPEELEELGLRRTEDNRYRFY